MLREVGIKNFKCFADQIIPFSNLTMLTGLNGTGKSTVLQILLLLRQSFNQGTLTSSGLLLNGEFVNIGTGKDALYQNAKDEYIGFSIYDSNDQNGVSWVFKYEANSDLLKIEEIKVPEKVITFYSIFSKDFRYLSAERLGPRTFYQMTHQNFKKLGIHGEHVAQILSLFGNEIIKNRCVIHPKGEATTLRAQTEAWLGEISPGTRISVLEHSDIDLVSLRYRFVGGKDISDDFRPVNVGFGLSYTLPVIVALLSATPGSILIIENPEAHLHPQGQVSLGNLIARVASSGVQVIVESHSDHLLNGIRIAVYRGEIKPEEIVFNFFERLSEDLNTTITTPSIDSKGRIDYWPHGFFDEWDKSIDILLGSGGE